MTLSEFGNLIRNRRESLLLRQEDLAELAKVALRTIVQIENGVGNPSFSTLEKIAHVLGMQMDLNIKKIDG